MHTQRTRDAKQHGRSAVGQGQLWTTLQKISLGPVTGEEGKVCRCVCVCSRARVRDRNLRLEKFGHITTEKKKLRMCVGVMGT